MLPTIRKVYSSFAFSTLLWPTTPLSRMVWPTEIHRPLLLYQNVSILYIIIKGLKNYHFPKISSHHEFYPFIKFILFTNFIFKNTNTNFICVTIYSWGAILCILKYYIINILKIKLNLSSCREI